jgi:uncharacterized membrane protein YphA (DoxX/SURF4 family)
MNKKTIFFIIAAVSVFFITVQTTFAHEVYVLSPALVAYDISHPSPNPLSLIVHPGNREEFLLCAIIGVILVGGVFLLSISRWLENALDPMLMKIKRFAPIIARLTLGFSLIAAAYYKALFGPELPLASLVGQYALLLQVVLYVIGILIVLGLFVRESAFVALVIFIIAVVVYKTYMLTYVNYVGEITANMILGGGLWSLDRYRQKFSIANTASLLKQKIEPYAFPVLRVLFGVSALYASWYAKLFHSELALDTVYQYHLTNYFHFPPLFIVLGALIIESLIGFFFILGVEIRFTAIFFLFFLTLSLFFFGEVVWPHLVLIGVNIAFIFHGYDNYSLEGRFFKKRHKQEPVF